MIKYPSTLYTKSVVASLHLCIILDKGPSIKYDVIQIWIIFNTHPPPCHAFPHTFILVCHTLTKTLHPLRLDVLYGLPLTRSHHCTMFPWSLGLLYITLLYEIFMAHLVVHILGMDIFIHDSVYEDPSEVNTMHTKALRSLGAEYWP